MNEELLAYYQKETEEEKELAKNPDRLFSFFDVLKPEEGDDRLVLASRQPVQVYRHPRFVAFPDHAHTFLEVVYMYSGSSVHVISRSDRLTLQTGDLLFLRPGVSHATSPASREDIAVHIQFLPDYLSYPLEMLRDDTYIRQFLWNCMAGTDAGPEYLHFHLKDIPEALNLLENILLIARGESSSRPVLIQATLGVLLLELITRTYLVTQGAPSSYEQKIVLGALSYIDRNFATASLEKYARSVNQPSYFVSRLMKRYSPYSFTTYVQRRRLLQARRLLVSTALPVEEIISRVGYENSSYFHKIFRAHYGMTPRQYRLRHTRPPRPLPGPSRPDKS